VVSGSTAKLVGKQKGEIGLDVYNRLPASFF